MTAEKTTEKPRPPVTLTTGSLLSIRSADKGEEPLLTRGVFRGYVNLGGDQALSIELDGPEKTVIEVGSSDSAPEGKGRVRLVPCVTILSIDILSSAKAEEEKKVPETRPVYFG